MSRSIVLSVAFTTPVQIYSKARNEFVWQDNLMVVWKKQHAAERCGDSKDGGRGVGELNFDHRRQETGAGINYKCADCAYHLMKFLANLLT